MAKPTAVWSSVLLIIAVGLTGSSAARMLGAAHRSSEPKNAVSSSSSESEIRGEVEQFRQAILHMDMKGVTRYYWNSPDLVVFDVIPPLSYVGWESFRKDWDGFFVGFKQITVYDWTDIHIEAVGNLGWMRALVHIVGTLPDGKPFDMTFRDTAIFERKDGKWVVVHDHGSVPILFETGQAVMNAPPK